MPGAQAARFKGRVLTSLLAAASFLVMGLTGLVLYITPQGRIAYWTDWRLLGLTKTDWGNIHILAGILFLAAGAFHVYFNWKPLVNYLTAKAQGALKHRRELLAALAVTAWVAVSAVALWPPLSWLIDLNDHIKEAWVAQPQYEPPFGHAEQLSLKGFARKMRIPLEPALTALAAAGVAAPDPGLSLEALARANNTSSMALYMIIKPLEQAPPPQAAPASGWTVAMVEERLAGTGLGRKPLEQAAAELGVDLDLARQRLAAKGWPAQPDESLRDIAERHDTSPMEVAKAMLDAR